MVGAVRHAFAAGACMLAAAFALLAQPATGKPPAESVPLAAAVAGASTAAPTASQGVHWPNADYDPAIPTAQTVLGHEIGAEIVRHAEVRRYFGALAGAAPDRMIVREHGASWEGRSLFHAVISAPKNLARLDQIQQAMARLADPRALRAGEADRIIAENPAVVWLGYSVHGNEPGTTDAAMYVAYHLLASRGDTRVRAMLDDTVIVIVPLQNPDGRERFINSTRAARGLVPDMHPLSAERDEPWPGGRMNHYVFDMNRDWFTQTQPEMQAHVALMLRFKPVVVADVHEMGTDQTFFFPPEADPLNPHLTRTQLSNVELIGRNNAEWFDRFGLRYFTREIFDGFFPGYGSGWPNYQGSSAMVYEQGSSRGLIARRSDGSVITFADTVQSQVIASLSAIEVVSKNRAKFLRDFAAYRASAVDEGRREPVKAYVISADPDPDMAARLATTLVRNGIEVTRTRDALRACGGTFPAGSYVISAAQPAKRLIRTLLDEKTVMDPAFVRRQEDRVSRGLPDEIYDVTAWSLPLMYNVKATPCDAAPTVAGDRIDAMWRLPGALINPQARVAFLAPWGTTASARLLTAALREGLAVRSSNRAFTADGVRYPAGSLMFPVAGNTDLSRKLAALVAQTGATVRGVESGWVSEGPGFGSGNMLHMSAPRIALAWDEPTERYSAGHARFVLERQFGYPVTLVRTSRLASGNIDGFDVIIFPGEGGSYENVMGKRGVDALKSWVQRGGVLVSLGTGTAFLADPDVDLLPIRREDGVYRAPPRPRGQSKSGDGDGERKTTEASEGRVPGTILETEDDLARAIVPEKQSPRVVAGVIARAAVDTEHWLGVGVNPQLNVLVTGNDIYSPARQNAADTVARFAGPNDVLVSGVLWDQSRRQLAFKPFVVSRRMGRGAVVGFTQDPNFRAQMNGLNLIFVNAVFRGAALTYNANSAGGGEEDVRR